MSQATLEETKDPPDLSYPATHVRRRSPWKGHVAKRSFFPRLSFVGLLVGGGLMMGAPSLSAEGRHYDARLLTDAKTAASPSPEQRAAIDSIKGDVADLVVSFDQRTGATRSLGSHVGYLTEAASGEPVDLAQDFARDHLEALGLTSADFEGFEVTDVVHADLDGATHLVLRQIHRDLPVYNGQMQININRDGRILSVQNAFVPRIASAVSSSHPSITASDAVSSLARHLEYPADVRVLAGAKYGRPDQKTRLTADGLSTDVVVAQLMWLPIGPGEVRLVWNFQIDLPHGEHYFDTNVDAATGQIWTRFDRMKNERYRVYPFPVESPLHSSPPAPADGRTVELNPADPLASSGGWFHPGATALEGPNAQVCADFNSDRICDVAGPSCGEGRDCDFALDLSEQPVTNLEAALTNAFYWTNTIHDIHYHYGFDEAAGNFQVGSSGGKGLGSDPVLVYAQRSSETCNARFLTPEDGQSPEMWLGTCGKPDQVRDAAFDNGTIVHEYGHGISNRLVGGPSNVGCLEEPQQQGEGWSDFLGLAYTARPGDTSFQARGIGNFYDGTPIGSAGFRRQPYSLDPEVNALTLASLNEVGDSDNNGFEHRVGEVWAQALWEVYWALVDAYGFEQDWIDFDLGDPTEAGNKRALFYVTKGMQNTPCDPTFMQARDGIIQAATDNFGGEDVCRIWQAFADFGLGTNAFVEVLGLRLHAINSSRMPVACPSEPPVARFTYSGTGLEHTFDGTSSSDDRGIIRYQWDFPDDVRKTGAVVTHLFPQHGSHDVTLTVFDSQGQSDSISQTIVLTPPLIDPQEGLWWNPERSGNGFDFYANNSDHYTMIWYTYSPGGTPIWYLSGTGPKGDALWTQPLYRASWNGSSVHLTWVGRVRLAFDDAETAWFSWTLNGDSGGERFVHFHGNGGRGGIWYPPSESGWGITVSESDGVMVGNLTFFRGSQPRWVQGQAGSSDNAFMPAVWFTGPGLCPSCDGDSPPTSQVVGSMRIRIPFAGSADGNLSTWITTPLGATWNRFNVPIRRLTSP